MPLMPERVPICRPNMPEMLHKMPRRIVIYAKDVENITGRKSRASRMLLQRIREKLGKEPNAFVTVKEFCEFTGIAEAEVKDFLRD